MPFPRNPRFRRAESFTPMELTARDADILRAVNRHRFLRSHQIADLVGGSRQQVLRRLQKLYHHGYIERPTCQLDYYQQAGSRSIAYGLASRGAALLRRVDDIPFSRMDWTARNHAIKRLFLEHALMVSDIMVALEIACRKCDDVRLLIEDEIPLPAATRSQRAPFHWTVLASGQEKLGVIPDRVFALAFSAKSERVLCFLEADRGTMPVGRATFAASSFVRKLRAYEATWTQGVHRSRFGFSRVRVLTVTTSTARLENLTAATTDLERGKGLFLFTDTDAVASAMDLLALSWRKSDGSTETLLAR
jgi:DNA-binding Lrp family transcriptional regulator